MHETNKKPMKGWLKVLLSFLGGALITVLIILTTSGVFLTGALIKSGDKLDPSDFTICESNCNLTVKLKDLTKKVNDFITLFNNGNYSNRIDQVKASLQLFHEEYWNAKYSTQLYNIRTDIENFKNEYRSANYSGQINNLNVRIDSLNSMFTNLAAQLRAHTEAHNAGNYPPIYPY